MRPNDQKCRTVFAAVFTVALAFLGPSPDARAATEATSRRPGTASLSGVVVGTDGAGVAGAIVTATSEGGDQARVAVSGEHGVFGMAGLRPGRYTVEVSLDGVRRVSVGPLDLASDANLYQTFEISLEAGDTMEVVARQNRDDLMASELRETGGRDVAEAMTELPGVWKLRKGGAASDVVLRGYQGENLNVLIDGVRVQGACPNNMDPCTFHVDLSEVQEVQVSKGPFDVKNVGSLGGAVNVVTRRPQPGPAADLSLAAGSYGYLNPSMSASFGGERVAIQAGYSSRRSDPFRDGHGYRFTADAGYRPGEEDSDAFRVKTGWAGLFLSPTPRDHVRLAYTRQEADHVLYPYLLMDGVFDNTDRFQVGYERQPGSPGVPVIRFQGYATHVVHWMTDELRTSSMGAPRGYGMGTYAKTGAHGGRVEAQWKTLTVGAETTARNWYAETRMAGRMYMPQYAIPDVWSRTLGAYAILERPVADGLTLSASGRVDRFRSSADPRRASTDLFTAYHATRSLGVEETGATGSLRLEWAPMAGLEVWAGAGSVVRFPDAQELFFGLRRMGADWVGNPGLRPSRNTGLDAGAQWRGGPVLVRFEAFSDRIDGFVVPYSQRRVRMVPGVMNPAAKSYANVVAEMRGFEASASAVVAQRFFVTGDLAAVRGTKTPRPELGILSRDLPEIPPLTGRLAGRYDDGRLFAELEGVFTRAQQQVDADLREEPTPGWGICNLRAGITWRGLSLTASLNNLFDRYYVENLSYQRDPYRSGTRVAEPGRNLTVTAAWRF